MPFESPVPWFPTDSKLFEKGQNIGLPLSEYRTWTRPGFCVLEVGTGTNASALRSILDDKINVIGIEPGMNYKGGGDKYQNLRNNPDLSKRIAPLNAVDAIDHPLMPIEGVDVIFAQNINFAQYTNSRSEFFAQLYGLVRCLKINVNSYITFESLNDDLIFTTRAEVHEDIDLRKILNQISARWTTRENKYGLTHVIIYRVDNDGNDIIDKLNRFI